MIECKDMNADTRDSSSNSSSRRISSHNGSVSIIVPLVVEEGERKILPDTKAKSHRSI